MLACNVIAICKIVSSERISCDTGLVYFM